MKSLDEALAQAEANLEEWRKVVDEWGLTKSDTLKMYALPFYAARRAQAPSPQKGQWQYDLFKELTGINYDHYANLSVDEEKKPTPMDWEPFLPDGLVKEMKEKLSPGDLDRKVRKICYEWETNYEKHT